jgi:hypothetical protein
MRLLLISTGTLLIAFLIGSIVRLWGLSLPYRKFEHPFFSYTATSSQTPVRIPILNTNHYNYTPAIPGKSAVFSAKEGKATVNTKILWINVYITSDKKLVSDFGFNLDSFLTWAREKNVYKGKYPHGYKSEDLSAFWPELVTLETAVKAFPEYLFVLNILSNDLDIHKEVVAFVEANTLSDRVLINSPTDIIIKSVKEIRPMWVYGTSISEVTRVKTFASLHLESAISVRGDVFVAPISYLARSVADQSMVTEMKRRKKFVFLGPLVSESEIKLAEELAPDGIIY